MSNQTPDQAELLEQIFELVEPEHPFNPHKAPLPYNYGDSVSWAAWPHRKDNAGLIPENTANENVRETAEADVFFIYPTTYFGKGNWNQPADNARAVEGVIEMVLPSQASVFNGCARIYAPWYRQATLYSFFDGGENGYTALELAYQDVARAFRYFLEHENKERPFIIAGHSQGTCHAIRLLEEEIDQKPCLDRFIVAYLGGYHVPMDKFERSLKKIKPSDSPDDIGTAVGWDTVYAGYENKQVELPTGHWYPTGWEKYNGKRVLATNLLNWKRNEEIVDSGHHLGVLDAGLGEIDMAEFLLDQSLGIKCKGLKIIDSIKLSAQNRNDFLCVKEDQGNQVEQWSAPLGNLHNFDYSLFYMNIRENAKLRVQSYYGKKTNNL